MGAKDKVAAFYWPKFLVSNTPIKLKSSLMNKIQMVDLLAQYDHIQEEVDKAILDVVRSSAYINGPEVKQFQADLEAYLGVKHVIPCANGTDALQIALMALGLKPGDEVITSDFTFIATVEVVAVLGIKPVLVDVDPNTFNIDPEAIRKAITPNTKAIVPVHVFGQCANMDEIMAIAKEHDLFVVEDNAQAIGADYTSASGETKKGGTIGHIGTTSFFPSKNLGCYGDGGAIFTNDDDLAASMRMIVNHGMRVRYYHDSIGVNSRLDSIQAAVLRVKLPHLESYCSRRGAAADFYDAAFADVSELEAPARDPKSTHVFHQYTLKTNGIDRAALQAHLSSKDVPAMIYYPVPLHNQKPYAHNGYIDADFAVTNALCECVISLPMHSELTEEQQQFIVDSILEFIKQ
jgi:UDP-2-acetamido-2-deoxy-ribo-hexuluronate aminotransferase